MREKWGKKRKDGKMKRKQMGERAKETGNKGRRKRSNIMENVKGEGRKIGKEKNIRNKWLNKEKEKLCPYIPPTSSSTLKQCVL